MPKLAIFQTLLQPLVRFRHAMWALLRWHYRLVIGSLALLLMLFAVLVCALQFWLFPNIDSYRDRIAGELSQGLGREVHLGALSADWEGVRPHLHVDGFAVSDRAGQTALSLAKADATLSWWTLLIGDVRFYQLKVQSPKVYLDRSRDGKLLFAGFELGKGESDGALPNWLLRQHELQVQDGVLVWRDDLLQAPELSLEHLQIHLTRFFDEHVLDVAVTPPAALGLPGKLHLEANGGDINDLSQWQGHAALTIPGFDASVLSPWMPPKNPLLTGRGALNLNLQFADGRITQVGSGFGLRDVSLQLADGQPAMVFPLLQGRLGWTLPRQSGKAELVIDQLQLESPGGVLFDKGRLHYQGDGFWQDGLLTLSGFKLEPLLAWLPALPAATDVHSLLSEVRFKGELEALEYQWRGGLVRPADYQASARFHGIELLQTERFPGVSGLNGAIEIRRNGGEINVDSTHLVMNAPKLFIEPLLFNQARIKASWTRKAASGTRIAITQAVLSNADMDLTVGGQYQLQADGPGIADLDFSAQRVRADKVYQYIPLVAGEGTVHWLKGALLSGEAQHARGKLRGNLRDFPFADGESGEFRVEAQARKVNLNYAQNWPVIEGIDATLLFKGEGMDIQAERGNVGKALIGRTRATIPKLADGAVLTIDGEASGPTQDFITYLQNSPLDDALGNLPAKSAAQGTGRLKLKLDIPLHDADKATVAGSYAFDSNKVKLGFGIPELDQVNGALEFTERGLSMRNLSANSLGGSLVAQADTAKDQTIHFDVRGRAAMPQVAKQYDLPWPSRWLGSADYKVDVNIQHARFDVTVESLGQGVEVNLPEPLAKRANDFRPFRLKVRVPDATQERWSFNYGNAVNANLLRRVTRSGSEFERGVINLGGMAELPARKGLWVTGGNGLLDVDQWMQLMDSQSASTGTTGGADWLAGIDLDFSRVILRGRQLNGVSFHAQPRQDGWQVQFNSKEAAGQIAWNPQGRGRVFARMQKLYLPFPAVEGRSDTDSAGTGAFATLPALDIQVDDFQYQAKKLGKLELLAQQQKENWLLDKVLLSNPDGNLLMQGLWRSFGEEDFTSVKVSVDSGNVGKLLNRFGYPDVIRRGSGKLSGQVTWKGTPMSPDFTTLSGNLKVKAENGQFSQVEPGVGRLLGVLSLQSLPRRVTLDFRDVFSEGLAFDSVTGDSTINRGVIATRNLQIVGPAVSVLFEGEADLGRETQNLKVRIVPTVGDSVAVAAAIANPVVGVTAFLVSRALQDPLGQLVAYEYQISGSWRDPKVERLGIPNVVNSWRNSDK